MNMTATIKRIVTRWTLPALMLIAAGFVCDGLTEVGHHAFLIAGGIALGIGIGRELRSASALEGRAANPAAIFLKILRLELGK